MNPVPLIKVYTVEVKHIINMKVDVNKFTSEFMQEFRDNFYYFTTVEEHVEHLAQLYARGHIQFNGDFVEGYGRLEGIEFYKMDWDTEIIDKEEM